MRGGLRARWHGRHPYLDGTVDRRNDLRVGRADVVLEGRQFGRLWVHLPCRYFEDLAQKIGPCIGMGYHEACGCPLLGTFWRRGESTDWTGCKQGASASPALWSALLDEVLAPILQQWQGEAYGCTPTAGEWGRSGRVDSHLAFVDDIILVAKRHEKRTLRLWSNFLGQRQVGIPGSHRASQHGRLGGHVVQGKTRASEAQDR